MLLFLKGEAMVLQLLENLAMALQSLVNLNLSPAVNSPFTKEQLMVLQCMLGLPQPQGSPSAASTSTIAQRGNFSIVLKAKIEGKSPWIMDSEASNHMTGDFYLFETYTSCPENSSIKIADGTIAKVKGKGAVTIHTDLILQLVSFVPNLSYNLLC